MIGIVPMKTLATSGEGEISTGFTYTLNFPENQIDPNLNYYNLMMNPGQTQEISLMLSNPSTETITVGLQLTGAKTNINGVIEWTTAGLENDTSLLFPFEDIVSGPDNVELAAGETKEVQLTIAMPETSYEGIIAGGLQLLKEGQEEDAASNTDGGSQVINKYAYAVAIILQESDVSLTPDLQYNRTYAGQSNYRNSMFVNLSNVVATFLNDLTIEAQISKQGSNTVLYEAKSTSMRMAPNSFIDFPVNMNGDRMEAGTYTAHVLATSGEQRWEWTEDFEISEDDANNFNERDVGLEQDTSIDWKLIAMVVAGFLIVVVFLMVLIRVVRKNKQKKEREQRKKKSKKKRK